MSGNNVVEFTGYTTLPIDPARMLRNLAEQVDLARVVVLVEREDGSKTFHSSHPDKAWVHFMAGLLMHNIVAGDFDG